MTSNVRDFKEQPESRVTYNSKKGQGSESKVNVYNYLMLFI